MTSTPAFGRQYRLAAGFASRFNLVTDLALLAAAVAVPALVNHASWPDLRALFWITAALASAWIVAATALRHYAGASYDRSLLDDVAMITIQVFAVITVLVVLRLEAPVHPSAPSVTALIAILWGPSVLLRAAVFRRLAPGASPMQDTLIVGIGPIARLTAHDMRKRGRHCAVGHLRYGNESDKDLELLHKSYASDLAVCAVLGNCADLDAVLRRVPVAEVYIAGNMRRHGDEMQAAIRVCERFGIPFALPAYSFRLERAQAVETQAIADGYLHYQNTRPQPHQEALKRLFDIAISALALWLLVPLFAVVSALIKLTSRGPVFFRQTRVGRYGRPFQMLKFRSMMTNAESLKATLARLNEQNGPVFKMRHDPRVTRVGRFIRKYSIDELPQLINVLRGEMSIVGPRPPVPDEVAKYEAWQRRRLSVRPGLTCIWQVSGRNQISFEEWMYLDMQYIDTWSLGQDLTLIVRTVPAVITGKGAS